MKKSIKVLAVVTSLTAIGLISGCGDDGTQIPTSKIVKGIVVGETVQFGTYNTAGVFSPYSSGKGTAKNYAVPASDAFGNFQFPPAFRSLGLGIKTKGVGQYVDPTTGTKITAPSLAAPSGATNVSVLTTLVATAPTEAARTAIKANIEALGVKYDADLSGTVTTATTKAVALNEAVGTLIQTAGTANLATVLTNVNTVLATPNALASTSTSTAVVQAVVTPVVTTLKNAGTITAAQATTVNNAATNLATALVPGAAITSSGITSSTGAPVVVSTGSTGGTSGGTGTNQ